MPSSVAISLFAHPRASARMTSISREVSVAASCSSGWRMPPGEPARQRLVHHHGAEDHGPHRGDELGGADGLEQVAGGTGRKRLGDKDGVVVGREHEAAHRQARRDDLPNDLHAAFVGELYVDHHQRRDETTGQRDRFGPGARLPDDLDAVLALEQLARPLAHHGVVVHDHHGDRGIRRRSLGLHASRICPAKHEKDRDATGRLLRNPTGSTLVGSRSEHPVASRYRRRAATVSNEDRFPIEGEVSMHIGKRPLLLAVPLAAALRYD